MQKKFYLFIVLIIVMAGCANQSDKGVKGQTQLKFLSAYTDSLGQHWMGVNLTRDSRKIKPEEEVRNYPSGYTVKKVYFIDFQEDQYAFHLVSTGKGDKDRVLSNFPKGWYENASTRYTQEAVDCIGIVCVVRNSKGEEKIVFDADNDEDLSNDPILEFSDGSVREKGKKKRIKTVTTVVETEYYNGTSIGIMRLPVALRKYMDKPVRFEYSIRQFQLAQFQLDEKIYLMGLLNNNQIEYKPTDHLWIDINGDSKFDAEDHFHPINIPFFIESHLFEARELGRFGNYLAIFDRTPALTKGSAVPDFEAVTVDSEPFQLSKLRGKYVLLDFTATWCEPCQNEIFYLKEAYETFADKGLEIVSIGIDSTEAVKKAIDKLRMNWTHLPVPKGHPILEQFGISDIPYPFLIGPEGTIRAYYVDLLGQRLIKTLEKAIQ
ncbi:peroxiredoxin family protein [bacterium]